MGKWYIVGSVTAREVEEEAGFLRISCLEVVGSLNHLDVVIKLAVL